MPRGCENAVGEQTERGGRTERRTEMHLQTERDTREGHRVSDKESLLTDLLCAYIAPRHTVYIPEGGPGPRDRSPMNSGEEEGTAETVN